MAKRPLLATAADQRRFIPAGARAAAREAALRHRNTLVVGPPGSGKTSLLASIAFAAGEQGTPHAIVPAQQADNSWALINLLCAHAADEEWIEKIDDPAPAIWLDPLGPARQIRRLLDAPERAIVLIDDPTTEQAQGLFGRLRDELWQTPLSFVVATSPAVAQVLERPPADAFFDVSLTLGPFDSQDAAQLFVYLQELGSDVVIDGPPAHPLQPRALIAAAAGEEVHVSLDPELQQELVERATQAAGSAAAALLPEIWNRGAVSASDGELQRALGVSRSRLTEMLRALADAGVVQPFPDAVEGRAGRPRMMYAVVSKQ